eukprot:TRINITY_DN3631_c0_g1_i1.p2 TRINITY_DN3631_c0_g1~~TRINITY_DN3631_c0_g1_i1.p2  ORF type:complete len:366 (+),score=122.95 TRINITY_DN3631_c0_g1_i1:75-1172(+)
MAAKLGQALTLRRGPAWANRMILAPMTNSQSYENGVLSPEEEHWLTLRAKGGFGMVMTCASHVQAIGKGFKGQLGCFGEEHVEGLTRLAQGLKARGAASSVQLHHAGMRSPPDLIGGARPVCASDNEMNNARALTLEEVRALERDFIDAARRCEACGFDGVELHGAHGYVVGQFLSPEVNTRTDEYGGSLANRMRFMHNILDGIRNECAPGLQLGVRLSPERFGMNPQECAEIVKALYARGDVDYLDVSLWDIRKGHFDATLPHLLHYFTALPGRGDTRLGVSGKIKAAADVQWALDQGADFVAVGRGGILHHDFAARAVADPTGFHQAALPVSAAYLAREGLAPSFIDYMRSWPGFVEEASPKL